MLLASKHGSIDAGWVVINTRLRTRTALAPKCHVDALGPPWLVTACPVPSDPSGPPDIELYSLADRTQQPITAGAGVPQCAWPPDMYVERRCASEPDGVGADWIRWDASCYNCGDTSFFQNIETGEVRSDPTNATTFADLNSPALARRTCRGVRLIRDFSNPAGVRWGSVTQYGQWALVRGHNNSVTLERCGTRMRRVLVAGYSAVASNPRVVVWQAWASHLNGLFLPSLQRFTLPLPSAIAKHGMALAPLVLSSGAIHLRDGYYGTFWRAASPAALPQNRSRPSVTRSGSTLICSRGSWRKAHRFSYAWRVDGITHNAARPTLNVGQAGGQRRVSIKARG